MAYIFSIKKLLAPALALVSAGGITALQLSNFTEVKNQAAQPKSTEAYLLEAEQEKANLALTKRLPNFGFDNLIADGAFLKFLQYFGDTDARKAIGYTLSPDYFEIFVNRNPQFTQPYRFMSPATSLFAGRPDQSVEFIEQGLQSLSPETSPEAYTLWISKASDELLFLGDNQAAQKSYLQAAQWTERSSDPEAKRIGAIVTKTAEFLAKNPDSKNARISAWLMVLQNAADNETRQRSIAEIQKLGGQVIITEQNTIKIQFPQDS